MARGYTTSDDIPSRPARRSDSQRGGADSNYHYSSSSKAWKAQSEHRHVSSSVGRRQDVVASSSYAGGHYAESPIVMPAGSERTLAIVPSSSSRSALGPAAPAPAPGSSAHHRRTSSEVGLNRRSADRSQEASMRAGAGPGSSATLPAAAGRPSRPSRSNSRLPPPSSGGGSRTVSKITRSRSLTSRPAGVSVYHPNGAVGQSTGEVYPIQTRPATRMSSKSGKSHPSSTLPNNTTKAGVVVETMSAPNPFCPNTKGVCCLMVLVNLAIILVAIGFIIVLQLHDPAFVWNIGVVILVFGFFTVLCSLIYCMCICQESQHPKPGKPAQGELYWTHHWQKNIAMPDIKHRQERWEDQDHFPEDGLSDTSSSSRDYPRLYLESDYGQRTDRDADLETEQETGGARSTATYAQKKT